MTGSQRGVPGALIFFIYGAPYPHVFALWSPDLFSLEPGDLKVLLWSPEPD